MLGSLVVYAGLGAVLIGLAGLIRPIRWLRITRRSAAARLLVGGFLLALLGALWPAALRHSTGHLWLDHFMPDYQFSETHATLVQAEPQRVFRAIKNVTAEEILLLRTLTWIRAPHFRTRSRVTILNPPAARPILEVATASSFLLLREEPDREIVVGTVVLSRVPVAKLDPEGFLRFHPAGSAKATLNFHIQELGAGWCKVTTETRVLAAEASARRRFGLYWRLIYPGSATIRRMWLRAIQLRAEAALRGPAGVQEEAPRIP